MPKILFSDLFFDVAHGNFSRQTNNLGTLKQGWKWGMSHTFSVFNKDWLTFLCTRNGKCIVHIALLMHEFYHFGRYNATKIFWQLKKFDKKQTIDWINYTASCNGKVNRFGWEIHSANRWQSINFPATGMYLTFCLVLSTIKCCFFDASVKENGKNRFNGEDKGLSHQMTGGKIFKKRRK